MSLLPFNSLSFIPTLCPCIEKEVLVPLTSSLYVPGTVENVEKVTVDIGTGYYADIGLEAGETFFQVRMRTWLPLPLYYSV